MSVTTENVAEMQQHLRNAVDELDAAADSTNCGWCIKNIKIAADALDDMSSLSSYTDKTAQKIRSMTEKELREIGGKTAALRKVVREEAGGGLITSENNNSGQGDAYQRGISMVGKKEAAYIVMSEVALGTGLGFVANRLEEMYGAQFNPSGVWYMRLAPLFNVGAGLLFMLLGISGKVLKGEKMQMLGVAGGGAMIANGALSMLEGMYANMRGGAPIAARPVRAARPYVPAPSMGMARPVGVIPYQQITIPSF